jgi:serralysin
MSLQSELSEPTGPETGLIPGGNPEAGVAVTASDPAAPLQPQYYLNADARDGTGPNGKPSKTIDEAAFQIVRGEPGWSSALGVGFTVSYAFRANAPSTMPDDAGGFSRFNSAQIAQAELALLGWSDAANITFTRVGSGSFGEGAYSDSASILFGNYSTGVGGASAFAMYPGSTSFSSGAGDVWINSTFGYNQTPTTGAYGAMVLAHEIGHAIGLAHPGEYDAAPNTTITYNADATYYEDSRQYTVMSYFNEANTGGNFGGIYSAAPLLDDIAAIQLEYGINRTTRTGDTVYGFNANAERPWFIATSSATKLVFAVWDAGGTDTFDFSGYANNQRIDLREGHFSDVGGLVGNVAVAKGAQIENLRSGSGSDMINGNGLANNITAGAGHDTISGHDGQDYLRGEDGADSISGGSGFDDMNGNMGNDTVVGGLGDDWVVGGRDFDLLFGEDGDDIIYGNMGNDTMEGGVGADLLRGGQAEDTMLGGTGNDWLSGDRGDDTMAGGTGADTFYTFNQAGIDRVVDFSAAEGDRVQLEAGTLYTLRQEGADTIIDMGGGHQMILVNVNAASLPNGWIFGA